MGAAPKTRSCFSGGTGTGEPEPEGCESKAEAARTPGAAKAPKQYRDERAGQGNATERITTLLFAAAIEKQYPNHSHFASSGLADAGIFAAALQMRGKETGPPRNTRQRPRDDANALPRVRLSRDLTLANRITGEIYWKVSPGKYVPGKVQRPPGSLSFRCPMRIWLHTAPEIP